VSGASVEDSTLFTPRFDHQGLIPAVVVDSSDGAVVMLAYMNDESLRSTIETGEAHFWSRSRGEVWRKGATSGQILQVVELRTDCDQDALLLTVEIGGSGVACHTGRRSCFYRRLAAGSSESLQIV
jgi:phosphoribosyl-AMP cyclohydrolase